MEVPEGQQAISVAFARRGPTEVEIPMLSTALPVVAPVEDICDLDTRSCRGVVTAKSSKTARPVNASRIHARFPRCLAPPPHVARIRASFPRGCQARRHDVEDNIIPGCQAPLPHAARI